MKRHSDEKGSEMTSLELKYCERCGGLWVRERGAEVVYCENCERSLAELPMSRAVPKKKPQRVALPVQKKTLVEEFADEGLEFEAAGGAA